MKNDEDAPCDVCRSKYSEPSNEMVFCDMCDICVHQACYGMADIPEGPWFCKPCKQNVRPRCIFCPSKKGAMKETKTGNWAHVSCALWIPEVSFGIPETMDNIVNTEKIPKSRWSLTCSLCHVRGGACIQCYVKKCRTAYHVTCAFEFKLHMEMEDNEGGEQEIKFESFCLTHTAAHASGQNPHIISESSKKRKRVQENRGSNEDKNATRLPQTKAPLEEESRASTSHDTGFPVVSTAEKTSEESGNSVQNVNGVELFSEQDIKNFSAIPKGTARKSFALPPKNIQTLHQILPKLNGKMAHKEKGKFSDKSKQPSLQKKISSSKKPKTKSTKPKTKPVIHPNPPMQFASHQEGSSTTQNNRSASTDSQFSGTPHEHVDHIRQLFPTPMRQESPTVQNEHQQLLTGSETPQNLTNSNSINNLSSFASNAQQFLPSSTSESNRHTLSNITAGFSANATLSTTSKNDNFDDFSRYIKSLLQNLPFKKTLRVQQKIIALVVKECGVSSDDEFDALSLSSDE